jgi:hypothetical protein
MCAPDEPGREVLADIEMFGVILPGDRVFSGAESPSQPQDERVDPVPDQVVHQLPIDGVAQRRRAAREEIVATVSENRLGDRPGSGERKRTQRTG